MATLVSLVIGVACGAIAGFVGGRIDAVMMRFVDILYALPFMFFVILLMVMFGRNIMLIFVAIGAVDWLTWRASCAARRFEPEAQGIRRGGARPAASRTVGIIRRHIVPNVLGPVIVYVTLTVPQVILVESLPAVPRPRRAGAADLAGAC